MKTIQEIQQKNEKLSIGLISGTSLDGVDAALVKITGSGPDAEIDLVDFNVFDYPEGLKEKLLELSTPGKGSVDEICRYNVVLGEVFANAAKALLAKSGARSAEIDFIGSHGQTVHHLPNPEIVHGYNITSTLQLGEPSTIAKRTGILTIADFRPADMALRGEGAPLAPYLDFTLFRSLDANRVLLNIGGIANVTILKQGCSIDDVIAFDTGPGNMVIDFLMNHFFSRPYDKGGEVALSGRVSEELLSLSLGHSYFRERPPKSTGREAFGAEFCEGFLADGTDLNLGKEDLIATATELTVRSIVGELKKYVVSEMTLNEIIVSGGGTENAYIMKGLAAGAGRASVKAIDEYGIPSMAKEAIIFAVLANETLCGNPGNVPSTTGADEQTVLGKICF